MHCYLLVCYIFFLKIQLCRRDQVDGVMQTTYLSTNGLQELLRVAPRVMMSLDVLAEEREGEVVYNIQNNK